MTTQDRLYQELARKLIDELAAGKYAVGDRMPAERELSAEYDVSRPTVREAIIALEVQGLGTLEERLKAGDEIDEAEQALMQRALAENSVIVAEMTPFFD